MKEVIVSGKYQVVIPKAVRKQLAIKPGQKVRIERHSRGVLIDTTSIVEKYAGSLTGIWGTQDPAKWLRKERDDWDRGPSSDRRN